MIRCAGSCVLRSVISRIAFCALLLAACGAGSEVAAVEAGPTIPSAAAYRVVNARALDGSPLVLGVADGVLVDSASVPRAAPVFDAEGATIVPAFVDAHVHLSYDPVGAAHAAGGIAVAVDLGSPIEALGATDEPLRVLRAGPMITAVGGYPLDGWGRAGYGVECSDAVSCAARVDALVAAGAALLKVPIEEGGLDDASLGAVADRAHASHRLLFAHALGADAVARAAAAGVDVLAHTPLEPVDDALAERFRGRAVVSTLRAFGGRATTVDNLARLRAHGVDVLYGTDLGNTRTTGIDAREIALLAQAGLDTAAIVEAATATPSRVLGLAHHGALEPGRAASFLVYRGDLASDPTQLARPDLVVLDGAVR